MHFKATSAFVELFVLSELLWLAVAVCDGFNVCPHLFRKLPLTWLALVVWCTPCVLVLISFVAYPPDFATAISCLNGTGSTSFYFIAVPGVAALCVTLAVTAIHACKQCLTEDRFFCKRGARPGTNATNQCSVSIEESRLPSTTMLLTTATSCETTMPPQSCVTINIISPKSTPLSTTTQSPTRTTPTTFCTPITSQTTCSPSITSSIVGDCDISRLPFSYTRSPLPSSTTSNATCNVTDAKSTAGLSDEGAHSPRRYNWKSYRIVTVVVLLTVSVVTFACLLTFVAGGRALFIYLTALGNLLQGVRTRILVLRSQLRGFHKESAYA